jgi:hypothetical protein
MRNEDLAALSISEREGLSAIESILHLGDYFLDLVFDFVDEIYSSVSNTDTEICRCLLIFSHVITLTGNY